MDDISDMFNRMIIENTFVDFTDVNKSKKSAKTEKTSKKKVKKKTKKKSTEDKPKKVKKVKKAKKVKEPREAVKKTKSTKTKKKAVVKMKLPKQITNARKLRGLTQKIFMIEYRKIDEYDMEFDVMGTTKNVYTVKVTKTPTCTCPDHTTRFNRCKHIFFILRRIMKINEEFDDDDFEDKAEFNNKELKRMIKNMPVVMNTLTVDKCVKDKYDQLKCKNKNGCVEMKGCDDVCCICFDDLDNGEELDYCKKSCGRPIHTECFAMYCEKRDKKCLICGSEWITGDREEEDNNLSYINLS